MILLAIILFGLGQLNGGQGLNTLTVEGLEQNDPNQFLSLRKTTQYEVLNVAWRYKSWGLWNTHFFKWILSRLTSFQSSWLHLCISSFYHYHRDHNHHNSHVNPSHGNPSHQHHNATTFFIPAIQYKRNNFTPRTLHVVVVARTITMMSK